MESTARGAPAAHPARSPLGRYMVMDATFNIPRLYLEWGLSHHEPKAHTWHAPSGVQVFGHPDQGVPFLRARVILLYLSTLVRDEDSEFITGSLDDMVERFGISWPMENVEKHFLRVLHARFRCGDRCVCAPARCRELQSVASRIHYCPETRVFRLVVSRDFFRSAMKGIPCPVSAVQRLIQDDQLAALDLFIWYIERIHWQRFESVDALGPNGPFAYIKSAHKGYRKRKELARLHAAVVQAWPACPFHVGARERIEYDPARVQRPAITDDASQASVEAPIEPGPPAPMAASAVQPERIPPRAPPARDIRAARPRPARPGRAPMHKPKPRPLELPPRVLLKPRLPSLSPTATTVPCVPHVPELPALPALPALPNLPALPRVPAVPFALGRDPPDSS